MNKKSNIISFLEHGKIPPQAVDLEEIVLGAMLIEKDVIIKLIGILKPEVFYKEAHQTIYNAVYDLFKRNDPVDIATVVQELKSKEKLEEVGGAWYITRLTNRVAGSVNSEYHARIIIQKWLQRELIRIDSDCVRDSFEDTCDVFEMIDGNITSLLKLYDDIEGDNVRHISFFARENLELIKKLIDKKVTDIGIRTKINLLDNIILGLQAPDVIIIAARPGMGKTALMITIAKNVGVDQNIPLVIFSLEMGSSQLELRLKSQLTGIKYKTIRSGQLTGIDHQEIIDCTKMIEGSEIYIDDTAGLNIIQLRSRALKLKQLHGIKLILIDYLQLMGGVEKKGYNRENEIATISRGIKALAKDINVPIVLLSQLSRKVEDRGGSKKPKLQDLRESGAIEQDSDIVIFIYRPSYYGFKKITDGDREGEDIPDDYAELIIEKHRNGTIGTASVRFLKNIMAFKNYEGDEEVEVEIDDLKDHKVPF